MLIESGFVSVADQQGAVWSFRPSLARIASLGTPHEIVALFASLHGPKAAADAAYVLACLCDQEDASELIGCRDGDEWRPGLMPASEQIIIAQHLMRHGIIGKARPSKGDGKFADKFDAAEYIAAARVHLGLSGADAEALSMTEFQAMFEMKFPDAGEKKRDVPTREEYEAAKLRMKERRRG